MLWIGPFDDDHKVGEKAFLVRHTHNSKGWVRYDLRDAPPKTNQSLEYKLGGWCGTYNDVCTHSMGAVEIVKIARNGRVQVRNLDGKELDAMLEEFGFPELQCPH